MGLPFGFASHFAPAMLLQALEIYRTQYRPSARWPKPHAVVCVNLIAADTDRGPASCSPPCSSGSCVSTGDAGKLPLPVQTLGMSGLPAN